MMAAALSDRCTMVFVWARCSCTKLFLYAVQVDIRFDNTPINGSPFAIAVHPGAICGNSSIPSTFAAPFVACDGLSSPANISLVFDVRLRDCWGNPTALEPFQVRTIALL
jgi:hypothetical protein